MKDKHRVDVRAKAEEMKRILLKSARALSATIEVMQKLARNTERGRKPKEVNP